MPSDALHAQCRNCASFVERRSGRLCSKHDFLMPNLNGQVLCRDWRVTAEDRGYLPSDYAFAEALVASEGFRALHPDTLYYYHFFSDAPPAPLARFEALQAQVWAAWIVQVPNYGWALLQPRADYGLIPPPGASVCVRLEAVEYQFDIVEVDLAEVVGGSRMPGGGWEVRWGMRPKRILHCPAAPAALYHWLDAQLDLERYVTSFLNDEAGEQILAGGFQVYLQVLDAGREFEVLQLDQVRYRTFRR